MPKKDSPKYLMKKFRFQLMAEFIINKFPACKVADIAGGHGLLTHLLNQSGFKSVVIDPWELELP
jgi:2-polyprenyl-3-methyl-5-hydroxy-6-metoxy-1,4-benzoquinol methylase